MSTEIKKSIAVSIVVFIAIVAYYGSFLPMRKSMIFISTMQNSGNVRTILDFERDFSAPLDNNWPLGKKRLLRQWAIKWSTT